MINYGPLIALGSMVLAIVAFGVALFLHKQAQVVKQLNAELEIQVEEGLGAAIPQKELLLNPKLDQTVDKFRQ